MAEKRSRKSLSQQTEQQLYHMIVSAEQFSPGDKLPNENDLSIQLGVSRTTLREAIRSLTAQGLLEVRRGKGTYIVEDLHLFGQGGVLQSLVHTRLQLRDLFEARLIFEPEMAYLACLRATDAEMADILQKGRHEEKLIRMGGERTEADQAFHRAIVLASHNELMIRFLPMISDAVNTAVRTATDGVQLTQYTLRDHALIMDFLEARDAKGAKYAMTLHLHHAMRLLSLQDDLLQR